MAKHKHSDEVEPEAVEAPVEETPETTRKSWLVGEKGSDKQEVVYADTIEDAIRVFNGQRTNFSLKKLDILEG